MVGRRLFVRGVRLSEQKRYYAVGARLRNNIMTGGGRSFVSSPRDYQRNTGAANESIPIIIAAMTKHDLFTCVRYRFSSLTRRYRRQHVSDIIASNTFCWRTRAFADDPVTNRPSRRDDSTPCVTTP